MADHLAMGRPQIRAALDGEAAMDRVAVLEDALGKYYVRCEEADQREERLRAEVKALKAKGAADQAEMLELTESFFRQTTGA